MIPQKTDLFNSKCCAKDNGMFSKPSSSTAYKATIQCIAKNSTSLRKRNNIRKTYLLQLWTN